MDRAANVAHARKDKKYTRRRVSVMLYNVWPAQYIALLQIILTQ